MANEGFDRDSWERRWAQVLSEHPDRVASRPSNTQLLAEVGNLAAVSMQVADTEPRRSGSPRPGGR